MTPKDSLLARCLAVLSAALLAVAWTVGISVPASAAPVKGSLDIVSITDTASGLGGPVQNRPFNVVVRVLDTAGTADDREPSNHDCLGKYPAPAFWAARQLRSSHAGSGATISGATYSQFANGVVLRVRAASGVELAPDVVTVEVALTAVGANATPRSSR